MKGQRRRQFLKTAGLAGAAVALGACAPAAAPGGAGTQPSGGKAEWERQWDDLLVAARGEGNLEVLTFVGTGYRKMLDDFQAAFPGVEVAHRADASASIWIPKVQKERQASLFALDLILNAPNSTLTILKPEGALNPVRPLMFRPDVIDDKAWHQGLDIRFVDRDRQFAFNWDYGVRHSFAINTEQVREGEVQSAKDLLDPKWRGRMMLEDVRVGSTFHAMANIRKHVGDDGVKRLLVDQEPAFSRDPRQIAESLVRGRYPIVLGLRPEVLVEFTEQGVGRNAKFVDLPEADFLPATCVYLVNRAPHPNAAKLFVNWFLTREGQESIGKHLPANSARTDVPPYDAPSVRSASKTYFETTREENFQWVTDTQKFINDLVGIRN